MSNKAIASEVGERIEQLRLEQNLTQQQLADEIGLSRVSYRKLVSGSGKFENIIAVLRVLNQLDLFQNFMPDNSFSPMQQLKMQGKKRQRASTKKAAKPQNKNKHKDAVNDPELDW